MQGESFPGMAFINLLLSKTEILSPLRKPSSALLSYIRSVSSAKFSLYTNQESCFTVSYLINSCGLSPESAISASRKVKFDAPHNPDAVLNILQAHGFTETQISNIVQRFPKVLLVNPNKTLLPKLKFLKSVGFSEAELSHTLTSFPTLLCRSLDNHIIPCFNQLRILLGSNENVVSLLWKNGTLLYDDSLKTLSPNIKLLRDIGVPDSHIVWLLKNFPAARVLIQRNDKLEEIVQQLKEMGFDPKKLTFVSAADLISDRNKVSWERCYDIYTNRWGWSKDDIMMAFRKNPKCMISSEKKIMQGMQYLVDVMGMPANSIAKCPNVLLFSLEKRIKPRCSVIQVLLKKRIIAKDNVNLVTVLVRVEAHFLKTFVYKYSQQVPPLLRVYKGDIGVSDV